MTLRADPLSAALRLRPDTLDPEEAGRREVGLRETGWIDVPGLGRVTFDADAGTVLDCGVSLPGHTNALVLYVLDAAGAEVFSETYHSIGGGIVSTAGRKQECCDARSRAFAAETGQTACGQLPSHVESPVC